MGKIMLNGRQYGVGGIVDASDVKYGSTDVESALDGLNNDLTTTNSNVSKVSVAQTGWLASTGVSSIDSLPANSIFGVFWLNNSDSGITGTKPSTDGMGLLFNVRQSSSICRQVYIGISNSNNYVRYYTYSTGVWSSWTTVTI